MWFCPPSHLLLLLQGGWRVSTNTSSSTACSSGVWILLSGFHVASAALLKKNSTFNGGCVCVCVCFREQKDPGPADVGRTEGRGRRSSTHRRAWSGRYTSSVYPHPPRLHPRLRRCASCTCTRLSALCLSGGRGGGAKVQSVRRQQRPLGGPRGERHHRLSLLHHASTWVVSVPAAALVGT